MTLAPPGIHNLLHHLQSKQKAEGDEATHCEKAKICFNTFVSLAHAAFSLLLFALINCVSCDISSWALGWGGGRGRGVKEWVGRGGERSRRVEAK